MESFKIGVFTLMAVLGGVVGAVAATISVLSHSPNHVPDFNMANGELHGPPGGPPSEGSEGPNRPSTPWTLEGTGRGPGSSGFRAYGVDDEPWFEDPAMPPPALPLIVESGPRPSLPGARRYDRPGRGDRFGAPFGRGGFAGLGGYGSRGGGSGGAGASEGPDAQQGDGDAGTAGSGDPPEIVEHIVRPLFAPPPSQPGELAGLSEAPPEYDGDGSGDGGPTYAPASGTGGNGSGGNGEETGDGNGDGDGGNGTDGSAVATGIPEPAGWALLIPGLAALAWRRRRRAAAPGR